jgi:hypothetical protein
MEICLREQVNDELTNIIELNKLTYKQKQECGLADEEIGENLWELVNPTRRSVHFLNIWACFSVVDST